MSLAFSPSTERKDVSTRTRRHHSNDGSGLHEERRPQELAVSERRHSEHHDVHLRHDAQINGDLHRHGLQLLANVQRELRADQLVLPVACSEYTPPLQGLVCKEGDRVGDKAGDERETATCVWRGLQHLASVQRELQADQLVLALACSECSSPLQGLVCKEGEHVGVIASDEHEQPPTPHFQPSAELVTNAPGRQAA